MANWKWRIKINCDISLYQSTSHDSTHSSSARFHAVTSLNDSVEKLLTHKKVPAMKRVWWSISFLLYINFCVFRQFFAKPSSLLALSPQPTRKAEQLTPFENHLSHTYWVKRNRKLCWVPPHCTATRSLRISADL